MIVCVCCYCCIVGGRNVLFGGGDVCVMVLMIVFVMVLWKLSYVSGRKCVSFFRNDDAFANVFVMFVYIVFGVFVYYVLYNVFVLCIMWFNVNVFFCGELIISTKTTFSFVDRSRFVDFANCLKFLNIFCVDFLMFMLFEL